MLLSWKMEWNGNWRMQEGRQKPREKSRENKKAISHRFKCEKAYCGRRKKWHAKQVKRYTKSYGNNSHSHSQSQIPNSHYLEHFTFDRKINSRSFRYK